MNRPAKAPAFQWYAKDFLADEKVVLMSMAGRGAYITLLSHCWLEGSIPADSQRCRRLCGDPSLDDGAWSAVWEEVLPLFRETDNGRLVHGRLEREREKQSDWIAKSRAGGVKSGEVRRAKSRKGGSTTVPKGGSSTVRRVVEPNANTSSSSASASAPTSTSSSSKTPLPPSQDARARGTRRSNEKQTLTPQQKAVETVLEILPDAPPARIAKLIKSWEKHGLPRICSALRAAKETYPAKNLNYLQQVAGSQLEELYSSLGPPDTRY